MLLIGVTPTMLQQRIYCDRFWTTPSIGSPLLACTVRTTNRCIWCRVRIARPKASRSCRIEWNMEFEWLHKMPHTNFKLVISDARSELQTLKASAPFVFRGCRLVCWPKTPSTVQTPPTKNNELINRSFGNVENQFVRRVGLWKFYKLPDLLSASTEPKISAP